MTGGGTSRGWGGEVRAWLGMLDGLLTAVEETAWSARELADGAREVWTRGEDEVASTRDDAAGLSAQVSRLTQTGWMLARMAAGYRLHGLRAAFVSERRADEMLSELHATSARRFYEVSAVHGGAFMKVGQLLSARADLLPAIWIAELSQLQDAAPTLAMNAVRGVVESDFGKPLEELFASFDETPIGAASIGQVHRAVLHDGTTVAVKVQRPGIAGRVRMDLELLEAFVSSLRESLPDADYDTILGEVEGKVLAEVDYAAEARTTTTLSEFFASHASILVPRPVLELCSARVLTTAFVPGTKLTTVLDALDARAAGGDREAHRELSTVLGNLLEAYLRQVLHAGVFQADPHPGNLFVTPDGKVAVLDMGCAQELSPETRARYLGLLRAFMLGDDEDMTRLFAELGFRTRSGRIDTLRTFADALLTEIRQAALSGKVAWPTRDEMAARAGALLRACEDDPVLTLPGEFVMMARVFGTLGGLFSRYRPEIDFSRHVLPCLGGALF
ncbi:MAG TPA: AarF/ABC1/UbiB kinase family protein [Polyangiaceae bacterium]|nr:AarF/ABC1/UbiB kinase family protein [Polyangiaceae bacterium]